MQFSHPAKILKIMVGIILCTYLVLLVILNLQPVKNIWISEIEKGLNEATQTQIEIEDIEIGLFNRFVINGITIYDQSGEKLIKADKFAVKILLRDLLKRKINLRSVLLMDTEICLYQETPTAAPNYQFILDLLSSDNPSEDPFKFRIGSFIITRAHLTYDKRWMPKSENSFSTNHVHLKNLNANFAINQIGNDSINVRVRNFSGVEASGIAINKLQVGIEGNANQFRIQNFAIVTPNSNIMGESPFIIDITNIRKQNPLIAGKLTINNLSTKDFAPFTSIAKDLNFNFHGNIIAIQIDNNATEVSVEVKENNNHFHIALSSKLDFEKQNSVTLHHLHTDSTLLSVIANKLPDQNSGDMLTKFKECVANGRVDFDFQRAEGHGQIQIQSPIAGKLDISADKKNENLNVTLVGSKFNVQALLNDSILPNEVSFKAYAHALEEDSTLHLQHLKAQVEKIANTNKYHIRDIEANATIVNSKYICQISSNSPELDFHVAASCNYRNNRIDNIVVNSNISNIDFKNIGIHDTIFDGQWRGSIKCSIPKITNKQLKVNLEADSISVRRSSQSFDLNRCHAVLDYERNKHSQFNLSSNFITINAEGNIDHTTIIDDWNRAITRHMPAFTKYQDFESKVTPSMSFFINVHKGDFLQKTCLLPIVIADETTILGKLNKGDNIAQLSAHTEKVNYGGTALENVSLHLHSKQLGAGLLMQGRKHLMNDDIQLVVGTQLHDDLLETNIEWEGIQHHQFAGSLNTITSFLSPTDIVSSILPTTIHIGDSIWNLSEGEIRIQGQEYAVNKLTLNTDHQKLTLNGGVSSVKDDSLHIALENVNVGYILDKVDFTSVLFDGFASGNLYVSLSPHHPLMLADLSVKSFLFNNALLGDASINARWASERERIAVEGEFIEEGVGSTKVKGYVSPSENGLDLHINANKTNMLFLRYWVNNIVKDIAGRTTGFCRLYGPFNKLDFSGDMNIDATLHVPANGVSYALSNAHVYMESGLFKLEESAISAPLGGQGRVSANLRHNHLKRFSYDLDLVADKLLLYDKARSADMPFYATAFASGSVNLTGNPGSLTLNIDATPATNSIIVYTESEIITLDDTDNGFITYRNKTTENVQDSQFAALSTIHSPTMDMNMRFNINMNPSATLQILMDEVTGDHLNLRGYGTLTADYYNKGTFQLYGNYQINDGNYQMSIQDVLKKNFDIQPGSSIIFGGDSDDAQLSLKAVHTVPTASLADLNIGDNFSDRNIKADCILNIEGTAANPSVSFDLDLPNINDEEKLMVRKLIATEEDLNMQVIHLLGLGRFYTYDASLSNTYSKQSQSTVAANSLISSTISSQINEVITNAIGSKDWTFGTNISTGTSGWTDMGVDGVVSGKILNNRLIFNGNLGYHENQYNAMRGSNFVGDFDVKYLLNPAANIYLKAYSETNDKYFTKSALTTQGVSLLFQKDFMNLKDLLGIKSKTTNESTEK